MVKLGAPLNRSIILGLKGVIDFYSWKGIPVARRWPRKPTQPRSAAVQATAADFKFVTQGFKEITASAKDGLTGMTTGTQLVQKDEQVILFYGGAIEEINGSWPQFPPGPDDGEKMLQIDLSTPPTDANQTINVNRNTFGQLDVLSADVDFTVTSYTHFRLRVLGRSSAAGQTVTMQLAAQATPAVPLSVAGNDLVINNADGVWDSGWKPFAVTQTTDLPLCAAVKGSNTTVDLVHRGVRLTLKYQPS